MNEGDGGCDGGDWAAWGSRGSDLGEPKMGEEVMERAVMVEAGGRWERWKLMYVMVKQLFLPDLSVSSQEPEYLDFGALILRLVSGL